MAIECLVIGLGVFGNSLALNLKKQGSIVVAVDINDKELQESEKLLDQTVRADATIEDNLRALGVDNFDYCFVCIGVNMEASLKVTLHLNRLGAKKIVARSNSKEHTLILKQLGAYKVVTPEIDVGESLSQEITSNFDQFIKFSDNFSVVLMEALPGMLGKSLIEMSLRQLFKVNVLSVKKNEPYVNSKGEDIVLKNVEIIPDPNYRFQKFDKIYIVGDYANIKRFITFYSHEKRGK